MVTESGRNTIDGIRSCFKISSSISEECHSQYLFVAQSFYLVRTESYVHVGMVFTPNDCHAFIGVQEFITSAHDGAIIMANAET